MQSKSSIDAAATVEATVTSKGQVTLPKVLRSHLGIRAGSRIRFSLHPHGGAQVNRVLLDLEDHWKMADRGRWQDQGCHDPREDERSQGSEGLVMIVADTNVWARAYLNDDAAQARKARKALVEARSKGGVFVPLIVMAELAWVLRARWQRERVLGALENLLRTRGVTVESSALVQEALEASRAGKGGFADQLIAHVGFAYGAAEVVTFDGDFAKAARVRRLK